MIAAIFGCLILGTLNYDAGRKVLAWMFLIFALVAVILEAIHA